MKALHLTIGAAVTAGLVVVAFGAWSPAIAKKSSSAEAKLPESFPYDVRNGRRVPKSNRVTNEDGSWREEVKDGDCTTVREKSPSGEYREATKC